MSKPIIGISGNVLSSPNTKIGEIERSYANVDYIKAVEKAGGVPIILPVIEDDEGIRTHVKACDGIILSGGQDVHPVFYKEEPHEKLGYIDWEIDKYQSKIIKIALEEIKTILGICRGHQLLNVVCGGTLYQDLSEISGNVLKHYQEGKRYDISHKVTIESDNILRKLFGKEVFVNSFHHQCIKDLGEGLEVIAKASDGVIEAVQMKNRDFVVGVQWHPEMMAAGSGDKRLVLFKEFIKHC